MKAPKLSADIAAELKKFNDWVIERGARHYHIRIGGRLAGILPFQNRERDPRAAKNVISQIRRVRRELTA